MSDGTRCVLSDTMRNRFGVLEIPYFSAEIPWPPMCYMYLGLTLERIFGLKCIEGTNAAVTEIVGACERAPHWPHWTDGLFCRLAYYAGAATLHSGSSFGTRDSVRDTSICSGCGWQL